MKNRFLTTYCFLLGTSFSSLWGQTNPLDLTFGTAGIANVYSGGIGVASAIQQDGKILIAGKTFDPGNLDFIIARFKVNGTLDNTFGALGKVYQDFGSSDDDATAIAVQADGKILAGGYKLLGNSGDFALARYNENGGLDLSFSQDGKVTTGIGADDRAYSMTVQPNGKILMAGHATISGVKNIALVRYNPDGLPDSTFNNDGKVTTLVGSNGSNASDIVVQPDGKILVAGRTQTGSVVSIAVVRYHPDGSLDENFGLSGIVTTTIAGSAIYANHISLQAFGKILVAGGTNVPSGTENLAMVRYNTNGSVDEGFGNLGITKSDLCGTTNGVATQGDGKILASGNAGGKFALIRFNSNGILDETFGDQGRTMTVIGTTAGAFNIGFQPSGKVILGGYTKINALTHFALARYISDVDSANLVVDTFTVGLKITGFSSEMPPFAYPNPVHSSFQIIYELTDAAVLDIALYNLEGRLIQTLVMGEKRASGKHLEQLHIAPNLPPGQYVLNLYDGYKRFNINILKQ